MINKKSIFIGVHVFILFFILRNTFDLISLLFNDTYFDSYLYDDLNKENNVNTNIIPKIIHQTYKTDEIPKIWQNGQSKCINLHPDYRYIFWTDKKADLFIEKKYSWFFTTWNSYHYPIQKADVIRYFVLYHYGGIYIDLDNECLRKLDPLLSASAFLRKTKPTGISNDVMGSIPKHPFFFNVIYLLKSHQKNLLFPYITIMYSTGPLFLSTIWKKYNRWNFFNSRKIKVLFPDDYKNSEKSFFNVTKGSSWHSNDAKFIKWMGSNLKIIVCAVSIIFFFIIYLDFLFYKWISQ